MGAGVLVTGPRWAATLGFLCLPVGEWGAQAAVVGVKHGLGEKGGCGIRRAT